LRLAVDFADFAACCPTEQVVMDRQLDLTANPEWQTRKHVERVDDPPVGAVFDRDDPEIGMAAVYFFEHGGIVLTGSGRPIPQIVQSPPYGKS
jgi:hypothetical protein